MLWHLFLLQFGIVAVYWCFVHYIIVYSEEELWSFGSFGCGGSVDPGLLVPYVGDCGFGVHCSGGCSGTFPFQGTFHPLSAVGLELRTLCFNSLSSCCCRHHYRWPPPYCDLRKSILKVTSYFEQPRLKSHICTNEVFTSISMERNTKFNKLRCWKETIKKDGLRFIMVL